MATSLSCMHGSTTPLRCSPFWGQSAAGLQIGASRRSLKVGWPSHGTRYLNVTALDTATATTEQEVTRADFPSTFTFGSGVSSFQAEGSPHLGGRGNSIWDSFIHIDGNVTDGTLNYPSCDFYNLYEEDIKSAQDLGLTSFRLSISWTRIFPKGGQPGEEESIEGVQFYNRIINTIVKAGMQPLVTLFHWEVPQYLENDPEVLGFRTKNIVPYFVKLAETCFKHFGDRVKHWATVNEMYMFCVMGYGLGITAPGRCSSLGGQTCWAGDSRTEIYISGHNILLAHAHVYRLYDTVYKPHQLGVIGFNPCHFGAAAYSDSAEDKAALQRYLEFVSGWQMDPVIFGDYPKSMRDALGSRLPKFTAEESAMLKNSSDFVGYNYYSAYFIKNAEVPKDQSLRWYIVDGGYETSSENSAGESIGELTGGSESTVRNCASYLPPLLEWLQNRYGSIPIYITENGSPDIDPDNEDESLADEQRTRYIRDHITQLATAISEKGINVVGYYVWSLLDVYEWSSGHTSRFGLFRTNYDDLTRTMKDSGKWFKNFLTATSTTTSTDTSTE